MVEDPRHGIASHPRPTGTMQRPDAPPSTGPRLVSCNPSVSAPPPCKRYHRYVMEQEIDVLDVWNGRIALAEKDGQIEDREIGSPSPLNAVPHVDGVRAMLERGTRPAVRRCSTN